MAPSTSAPAAQTQLLSPTTCSPSSTTSASTRTQSSPQSRQWNTKNLGMRLGADAVSASCAAGLISPLIAFIDKSIMENASGSSPSILASLRTSFTALLRHPLRTLASKPVGLVFLLYGGTYLTANALDTASSTLAPAPARTTTSGPSKFVASSLANVSLCVYKDQAFVKLFRAPGAAAAPRPVPLPCFAIFALRDCLTIFASFNMPARMAPYLDAYTARTLHVSGLTSAQFLAPAAVQLLSTPLHLLGLDWYNRPSAAAQKVSWAERWRAVSRGWLPSCTARIGRIVPAFGVGGVVNYKVRQGFMTRLE
ncbi:sequence orphan [Cordyceps militaris]|uniref:Sequence orphan n=1 Tax=Cordyceps militaris TaxID=73501 RepID=A0A2H4SKR3_CORMI|nr:sequence orphan [Cordyceps militaris]